jgi:membrane protein DedA with SNARE-associated domain
MMATFLPFSAPERSSAAAGLTGVSQWAVELMEGIGAPGAGLIVALENLFPPLPSEIILPLAGFTASRGSFSLVEALLWTTIGSVLGAWLLYGIGALLGRDRMRAIARRLPLVDVEDVDKAENWFHRYGYRAVFFGRMIPLFRSLISIPAGIERMSVWKFLLLTLGGSLIWNTVFVLAGFYLGENWHVVEQYAGIVQKAVIAGVALAIVWWVAAKVTKRRRKAAAT